MSTCILVVSVSGWIKIRQRASSTSMRNISMAYFSQNQIKNNRLWCILTHFESWTVTAGYGHHPQRFKRKASVPPLGMASFLPGQKYR